MIYVTIKIYHDKKALSMFFVWLFQIFYVVAMACFL